MMRLALCVPLWIVGCAPEGGGQNGAEESGNSSGGSDIVSLAWEWPCMATTTGELLYTDLDLPSELGIVQTLLCSYSEDGTHRCGDIGGFTNPDGANAAGGWREGARFHYTCMWNERWEWEDPVLHIRYVGPAE